MCVCLHACVRVRVCELFECMYACVHYSGKKLKKYTRGFMTYSPMGIRENIS